ncbi:MAG: glycoside hydrolase family 172 protein [Planctomycetota bacterium]
MTKYFLPILPITIVILALGGCTVPQSQTYYLDQPQPYLAARSSSYDQTGANADRAQVKPKNSHTVANLSGPGRIVHMWFTLSTAEPDYLRTTRLKIYWDGNNQPAVDIPFGDFHALGHGLIRKVNNAFITVVARPHLNHNLPNKQVGGFNSYFPMPFGKGAKVVIENNSSEPLRALYYQIDYQIWKKPPSPLRFHAQYRETPPGPLQNPPGYPKNPDGKYNHVILDTQGKGHFIGVVLSVDAMGKGWWEGDDMFWIDGEPLPSINGTGTEDYFGGAWGFRHQYNMPCHGITILEPIPERQDWRAGKFTVYRFHQRDPVPFTKSIKVSIERGHANDRPDCPYSSVAYWYQEVQPGDN